MQKACKNIFIVAYFYIKENRKIKYSAKEEDKARLFRLSSYDKAVVAVYTCGVCSNGNTA